MKKLLVLAFIVLFAAGASAQGNANFYIGEVDGSDFNAGVNKWLDVPVFFNGDSDVWVADLSHALGAEMATCDQFSIPDSDDDFWPFNSGQFGWSVHEFGNYNDDVDDGNFFNDPGWHSLSFTGFAKTVFQDPDWLFNDGAPIQILSFSIHTVDDITFIGTQRCALGVGHDPMQDEPNAGDTLGGAGFPVVLQYSCLYFSPNQNCEIQEPLDALVDCTYEDFTYCFDVYDPDSDEPLVTTSVGTPVLVGTTPDELPDEGTMYHYCIDFDMEVFCGDCFSGNLIITAEDEANFPGEADVADAGPLTIIGAITASMDPAVYIWPGMEEWMPVYLDVCGECFCLGGFVFTIEYDASILDITEVVRGAALMSGEYWNVNFNVDGPGTIRVTFINDLNNQTPVRDICGLQEFAEPLFMMKFLLAPRDDYTVDFCTPICFMFDMPGQNHYDYNNVSDEDGYHVWMNDGCDDAPDSTVYGTLQLDLECGNIKVMNEHNILIGDLNLNGSPFDVGDVVLLANHLIDPVAYPFTLRQMFASDVNGDGYQASIADLIYMINVINGGGGGKVAPLDVIASVAMPVDTYGDVDVTITSELSVGGALVSINHTGVELGVPTADGMTCEYSDNGDVMNVLVYNMAPVAFAPGTNVLFTVPVLSEGAISFGDVSVSDNRGALLDAQAIYDAPIPKVFSVSQNFPNPFNARTSLSFGLPAAALTTVNIYNVAGQLVESMSLGELTAGHHSVVWDASDVSSGIYFYKISAGDSNETMKMTLLK